MTKSNAPAHAATLTLHEETAAVSKEVVATGKVRVKAVTEAFEQAVGASLESEAYDVTRVTIDREVDAAPRIRTEGDLTIIPVLEEVLFVEKRLVLKEEIHLRRRASTDTIESFVTLRRQRVTAERVETPGQPIIETEPKDPS